MTPLLAVMMLFLSFINQIDLYEVNYKTLQKDIKEDLMKQRGILFDILEDSVSRDIVSFQFIYKFNVIPISISTGIFFFFIGTWKNGCKIYMEEPWTKSSHSNLEEQEDGRIVLSDIRTIYKATVKLKLFRIVADPQ